MLLLSICKCFGAKEIHDLFAQVLLDTDDHEQCIYGSQLLQQRMKEQKDVYLTSKNQTYGYNSCNRNTHYLLKKVSSHS